MKTQFTYIIAAFRDVIKQSCARAVEGKRAADEHVEQHAAAPHVHRLAVRLPLDHFRAHEVRRADATCNTSRHDVIIAVIS